MEEKKKTKQKKTKFIEYAARKSAINLQLFFG